jgi:PAS domain S-box-containing protein
MSTNDHATELEQLRAKVAALEQKLRHSERTVPANHALMSRACERSIGESAVHSSAPHSAGAMGDGLAERTLKSTHSAHLEHTGIEQALRESEARYARATAAAKVGVWELDVARGICHGDSSLKALFGYEGDELGTDPLDWLHLVHPDDQSMAAEQWFRVAAGQTEQYHCELRMLHKAGTLIWTEVRGQAVRDDSGAVRSVLGSTVDITERHFAEAALHEQQERLRQSEERLRTLMEYSSDIITILNADATIRYKSPAFYRLFGYREEDVLGRNAFTFFHPNDLQRVMQIFQDRLTIPGLTEPIIFSFRKADGGYLKLEGVGNNLLHDATVQGIVVNCREVTGRIRAEEALRASEVRLRALADHAPVSIFMSDPTGQCMYVNQRWCDMTGYAASEAHGRGWLRTLPPDEPDPFTKPATDAATIPPFERETRFLTKSGTIRWAEASIVPLYNAQQEITGYIGTSTDITERRRAQEELLKSHAFIRHIIDTDPNAIFAKDREGRYTLVNKAVADFYGTTVEALIGKTDADFKEHAEELEAVRRQDLEVMDRRTELYIPEETLTDTDGNRRWFQTVKRPLINEQGIASHVLGAATDITARKKVEEALRQREQDLQTASAERERISEELHDGLLQSLYGVGLVLETCKSLMKRDPKRAMQTLERAVRQLNAVMREVRNFIAGLESELLQDGDLSRALQAVVQSLASPHGLVFRLSMNKQAIGHITREQSLHVLNVVREAVSNSLRHSKASRGAIVVRRLKHVIRITVRDNGIGFSPKSAMGVGHGLMNMAARARRIGGRLLIDSKPKQGTRIVFDLPRDIRHGGS